MDFYEDIIQEIISRNISTKDQLHRLKIKLCKIYALKTIPSNSSILAHIPLDISMSKKKVLIQVLRKKPMRTISGVAIIAVMTSPATCPHGTCLPCPGGPSVGSPQSYTGSEPAAMRAEIHGFDPFLQVQARLHQLQAIGHDVDKIDLIIMGGTFTARLPWYQEWFVKRCYDALNGQTTESLVKAKELNETARSRCIGLTIETRPDWLTLQHVDTILFFGATRVELGVQTVFDDILYSMKRGHSVQASIDATRIAKDAGFKVCYHMMPGLLGSDEQKDLESFKNIFDDPNLRPDMIKIYPTLVIKGTPLYDLWKENRYVPLSTEKAQTHIAHIVSLVPEWVRIQRIQRDVPAQHIDAGVTKSNLRQLVEKELLDMHTKNRDIRVREIGHNPESENNEVTLEDIEMEKTTYTASNGTEVFLQFTCNKSDTLLGYLRLRDISQPHRWELQRKKCMIIRELKVVGREVGIGRNDAYSWQHKGLGAQLIQAAELICREDFDKKWLFVLSGVGVKQYYQRFHGFSTNGVYLSKRIP
ncbi:MAG: tRNA uridine(34) 5-carboxymethylaminomethyl modification radical SAM/GNAT enzyme Elp3 [Candidatus Thermoplasmatota archaeon]|nr:tRNA uridine(34) 5-carboxymethylaminomethyl modification radical SAM/GNAT enzyme Elp3 [Candidatus Thermoplasmatota archaeon]